MAKKTNEAPLEERYEEVRLLLSMGKERGFLYIDSTGLFVQSEHGEPDLTDAEVRAMAARAPLTYTCVPLGSGYRVALDADLDGCFNVTEVKQGRDPRDPYSNPWRCH